MKCDAHDLLDGRKGCFTCDVVWDQDQPVICAAEAVGGEAQQTVPHMLRGAAATFEQRNSVYGDAYTRTGALLLALFPEGGIPAVKNERDAAQLAALLMCVMKLQRYALNFGRGGHRDSAHDLIVYAAMLEEQTLWA